MLPLRIVGLTPRRNIEYEANPRIMVMPQYSLLSSQTSLLLKENENVRRENIHGVGRIKRSKLNLTKSVLAIDLWYLCQSSDATKVCYGKESDRRGLSRLQGFEDHPTTILEQPEDPIPPDYLKSVAKALSIFHTGSSDSSSSSPTTAVDEHSTTSNSQPFIWKSGNTTERSSVDSTYSWDEFDKCAAQNVQQLFEEIDSVLFEQNIDGPKHIHEECQEWGSQFPHLRILGAQLVPDEERGFKYITRPPPSPPSSGNFGLVEVTAQDFNTAQDIQGLSITGDKVRILSAPVTARTSHSREDDTPSMFSYLEEEIFEQEGEYEEIIAVDYKDIYEDSAEQKKQLTPRRSRVSYRYPPITPNACVKDSVASSAFDCLWQEVMAWMRLLLDRYRCLIFDESKGFPNTSLNLQNPNSGDQIPPSREPSYILQNMRQSSNLAGAGNLDGMLQISGIHLQYREKHTLLDTEPQALTARPVSGIPVHTKTRPMSMKNPLRSKAVARLAPLDRSKTSMDRSKTPSVDDDRAQIAGSALRVTKLMPSMNINELVPGFNHRNGALPPIISPYEIDTPHSQRFQRKASSSRASSAVDKEHRSAMGSRPTVQAEINRPSTTHAMRSDTPFGPFRRASTPFTLTRHSPFSMYFFNNALVSGSGLQPSNDLSNIQQDITEDSEGAPEDVIHNQWTPSQLSHNPYRRARQLSSLVRS
ncbi:hypothetical protein ScPMuIL_004994 [Solemya velum]